MLFIYGQKIVPSINTMLSCLAMWPSLVINAIDILPNNVQPSVIYKVLNRNQMETGGFARILELKVNARVMLTSNIYFVRCPTSYERAQNTRLHR